MKLKSLVLIIMMLFLVGEIDDVSFGEDYNFKGNMTLVENPKQDTSNLSFLTSLGLALIPIGVGGYVTRYVTNSWQEKKEKINIKKNILDDYNNSDKLVGTLLDTFVSNVFESYTVYENGENCMDIDDDPDNPRGFQKFIKFPTLEEYVDQNEYEKSLPIKKFEKEYKILVKQLEQTDIVSNRLFSGIRLFYQDPDLIEALRDLETLLKDSQNLSTRLTYSKNGNEFLEFYNEYIEISKLAILQTGIFEFRMVDSKLKV